MEDGGKERRPAGDNVVQTQAREAGAGEVGGGEKRKGRSTAAQSADGGGVRTRRSWGEEEERVREKMRVVCAGRWPRPWEARDGSELDGEERSTGRKK